MLETRYLDLPDGRIAYDDTEGEGELVIMLPGMGDLRSEYRFLAPPVAAAGYRVVTADLRGQGESSAGWPSYGIDDVGRDLLALVDHLDAGPAHAIGTSVAPAAMVWAGVERPEAFRSLTLIAGFVRDAPMTLGKRISAAIATRGPWKVAAWAAFYKSLYPSRRPDDLDAHVDALKESLRGPGRFEAMMAVGMSPRGASEERLGRLRIPALVIIGTADTDWPDPAAEGRFIADAVGGELLLLEGAGHYPQAERPDEVTPAVLDFLQRSHAS